MRFRSVAVVCALTLAVGCGDVHETTVSYERPPTAPALSAWSPGLGPPIAFGLAVDALELWHATETWNRALQIQASEVASRPPPKPPARRSAPNPKPVVPPPESASGHTGACGGDLPPCSVMMCESGGSLTIVNRSNPARPAGKWQIITSTWARFGGYATADLAPESVQDARARQIYNGGRGRGQWEC